MNLTYASKSVKNQRNDEGDILLPIWTKDAFELRIISCHHSFLHFIIVLYRCSKSSPTFHCVFNYLMCGLHCFVVTLDCECYHMRYATTLIPRHNVLPLSIIFLMKNLTSTSYNYNTPSTSKTITNVICHFFCQIPLERHFATLLRTPLLLNVPTLANCLQKCNGITTNVKI
jgi:hypothetical protein